MNCNCEMCKNNKPFDMPEGIVSAAIKGDLVIFCGAGISTENKMVMPYTFYSDIKNELENNEETISFSSLMQNYCSQPNGRRKLIQKIKDRFDYIQSFPELERNATRFHRELSLLYPIKTIITTNWDMYFEQYCGAIPITNPEDFSLYDSDRRHVLKIHGSINNISSIVATTDDYNACYDRLTKGVVGATLKTILATKTVVFIGFSFGDDDLNHIMQYIKNEMGEFYPHFYIVTIDSSLSDRIGYTNCTSIITDGTFFLHQLRQLLTDKKIIRGYTETAGMVAVMLDRILSLHDEISHINVFEHPYVIYTLMHQDGVIHAFERFQNGNKNGEYGDPHFMASSIVGYEKIVNNLEKKHNYVELAYYEGYLDGLIYISEIGENMDIAMHFPVMFLPGMEESPKTLEIYHKNLKELSVDSNDYFIQAKKAVRTVIEGSDGKIEDIVIHHPPF